MYKEQNKNTIKIEPEIIKRNEKWDAKKPKLTLNGKRVTIEEYFKKTGISKSSGT